MTPYMEVEILEIAGVSPALLGLGLSYGKVNHIAHVGKMVEVAKKLAGKGGGHDKFLESIMIWLDVRAPRYWWSQADTYRLSTKQSESTMHTLKKGIKADDFEVYIGQDLLDDINELLEGGELDEAKALLPEGFLQRRIWCMSLKTLANMVQQRRDHRLPHWRLFCDKVSSQLIERHDTISNIYISILEKIDR